MPEPENPIITRLDKEGFTEELMTQLERGWFGRPVMQKVVAEVRRLQKETEWLRGKGDDE